MKPWLTEREVDLLRAIHHGDVVSEHRRDGWKFYRRNAVTRLVEQLSVKGAITISGPEKPQITISPEALPLIEGAGHIEMTEDEYKRRFGIVSDDILSSTRAFYTYMEINKFATESAQNYKRLNQDGHFWSGQMYSLQLVLFIVLGRIFAQSGYSIHKFLKQTASHPKLFAKAALAQRKREAAGNPNPPWLADYLKDIREPTPQELSDIASSVATATATWGKAYKPIRDKIFAHHDLAASINDLFGATLVGEIEDILHDLNRVRICLDQLWVNGRRKWIGENEKTYAEPFIGDTRGLLNRL